MTSKQIFDQLKLYSKDYIFVQGYGLIKYHAEDENYYFDFPLDETHLFPSSSIELDLISEAFEGLDIEVLEEGFYTFEALIKKDSLDDYGPLEFWVEHIEYEFECDLNEHYRRVDEFYTFMNNNEDELPF